MYSLEVANFLSGIFSVILFDSFGIVSRSVVYFTLDFDDLSHQGSNIMDQCISIDGDTLEGGGQILRLSMSFCALLKKPVRVFNIRSSRHPSGLRPQHLKGLEITKEMCGGRLVGAKIGAVEISYFPEGIRSGEYLADTQTAGSVGLIFQVAFPIALFGQSVTLLNLKGGTNCEMAPPIDYTVHVLRPVVEKFGADFMCKISRRGYYPKGGGEVHFKINPVHSLNPVTLTNFGILTSIWGQSYVAGKYPITLATQMAQSAECFLKKRFASVVIPNVNVHVIKEDPKQAVGDGFGMMLVAETSTGCVLSSSVIGRRGMGGKEAGEIVADRLSSLIESKACVDEHTQDQIIILMALAKGKSSVLCDTVTLHTETAIYVAERMTDAKFEIQKLEGGTCLITCDGIGLTNSFISA